MNHTATITTNQAEYKIFGPFDLSYAVDRIMLSSKSTGKIMAIFPTASVDSFVFVDEVIQKEYLPNSITVVNQNGV